MGVVAGVSWEELKSSFLSASLLEGVLAAVPSSIWSGEKNKIR